MESTPEETESGTRSLYPKLSPNQRRELRSLARHAHEASQLQRAAVDAANATRALASDLRGKITKLQSRLKDLQEHFPSNSAAEQRQITEQVAQLQADLESTVADIEETSSRADQLTTISAPLNGVVDRVVAHARVSRVDLGIVFNRQPQPGESVTVIGAQ